MNASMTAEYFENMYALDPDPWSFASSPYEEAKYSATIRSLQGRRYHHILEVGCSIGVLTARLAQIGDHLTAIDVAKNAIDAAKQRCKESRNIRFEISGLPQDMPQGPFDLVVLSEVCYYWSVADLRQVKEGLVRACEPQAHILLVHWTPFVESYPQTGDAVHEAFLTDEHFIHLHGHRAATYRLDLFERHLA